jgi:hypothetical protein
MTTNHKKLKEIGALLEAPFGDLEGAAKIDRDILRLAVLGMSQPDIAERVGMTREGVSLRLFRLRQKHPFIPGHRDIPAHVIRKVREVLDE